MDIVVKIAFAILGIGVGIVIFCGMEADRTNDSEKWVRATKISIWSCVIYYFAILLITLVTAIINE